MEKLEPVASIGLCNTASLNLYDIDYSIEDFAQIGINNRKPRWVKINYSDLGGASVTYQGIEYDFSEFIRV